MTIKRIIVTLAALGTLFGGAGAVTATAASAHVAAASPSTHLYG